VDKLTVRDFDATDKRVFVRVDFNVPLQDGRVTDDSRIRAAVPTIRHLLAQDARVILASHLGRPDGRVNDGLRLRPVAERLTPLIGRSVRVTGDALGIGTEDAVRRLRPGEVLLLENLRFHAEEEKNDPEFARALASYADIYVNDAFGTAHRAHASTVGIAEFLPAYAGLLMEREIVMLSKLLESPERPFAAVLGGAKVSDKLKVLDQLTKKVDVMVVGGGMANTFLLAQGHAIGKSLAEHDRVDDARRILAAADRKGVEVVLPTDAIIAKEVTRGTEYKVVPVEKVPLSWSIVDIGPATRDRMTEALGPAKTVFWNGPLGVFEIPSFAHGTRAIARVLAEMADAGATIVVGGGDSVAALEQQGLASKMSHISTGGGASLEFLEGRELPGIAVILDRPAPEPRPKTPRSQGKVAKPGTASRPKAVAEPRVAAKQKATSALKTASAPKATPKPASTGRTKAATTPKATEKTKATGSKTRATDAKAKATDAKAKATDAKTKAAAASRTTARSAVKSKANR
jgi:phosphoglycerate kinase